jgi:hypothetical protein
MPQIEVRARARASRQRVWDLLVNAKSWGDWAPFDEVTVEQGHEVGEIRRVRSGRITTRERVTGFDPPQRYVYEILSGLPIRGYVAEVRLSPLAGGGTEILWQAKFHGTVPGTGWILKQLLGRVIKKGAAALARRADELS